MTVLNSITEFHNHPLGDSGGRRGQRGHHAVIKLVKRERCAADIVTSPPGQIAQMFWLVAKEENFSELAIMLVLSRVLLTSDHYILILSFPGR